MLRLSRPLYSLCLLCLLLSCQQPTVLRVTVQGPMLGGNIGNAPTELVLQLFEPSVGTPFSSQSFFANSASGIKPGDSAETIINLATASRTLDLGVAVRDPNLNLLGTARTPVKLLFGKTTEVTLQLDLPRCGDGFFDEAQEDCDDAGAEEGCPESCHFDLCGDRRTDPPLESCDLGPQNGTAGSGCSTECTLDPSLLYSSRVVSLPLATQQLRVLETGPASTKELALYSFSGETFLFSAPLRLDLLPELAPLPFVVLGGFPFDGSKQPALLRQQDQALQLVDRASQALLANIPLQDPRDGALLSPSHFLARKTQLGSTLVFVAAQALWELSPTLGENPLQSARITPLEAEPVAAETAQLAGIEDEALVLAFSRDVVIFRDGQEIQRFACVEAAENAAIVSLSVARSQQSMLLALRNDGVLCLVTSEGTLAKQTLSNTGQQLLLLQSATGPRALVQHGNELASLLGILSLPSDIELLSLGSADTSLAFDLDADGNDELLLLDTARQKVSVFQGQAETLQAPRAIEEAGVLALTVAELTGDALPDLVALRTDELLVFSGTALSAVPIRLALPEGVTAARPIDRDGDGDTDLALPCPTQNSILFVLQEDGGLSLGDALVSPNGEPLQDISVGNFDSTLGIDWAVRQASGVLLYLNVAETLPTPSQISLASTSALTALDLNLDFQRDLIVAQPNEKRVSWFSLIDGSPIEEIIALPESCTPTSVLAAEFDEDLFPDLMILCQDGTVVLQSNPAINPAPAPRLQSFASSGPLVRSDLNQDGTLDLVAGLTEGALVLSLGDGTGEMSAIHLLPAASAITAVVAVDVTQDGRAELIFAGPTQLGVWSLAN